MKSFVVNLNSFDSEISRKYSDVMLPIATNYEIDGSFVNNFSNWQSFRSSVPLFGKSKKSWKVIKTLAKYLKLEGFKYSNLDDLQNEIGSLIKHQPCSNVKFKMFLSDSICEDKQLKEKKLYINVLDNIYNSD